MAPHKDPVVRHAHRNLGPVIAFVLLFLAVSAMGYGLWKTYDKAETVETKVEAQGPPCVDIAPGPAVRPSTGCRRFFTAIANLCAQDPQFCRQSQRRAARAASADAATDNVGRMASAPDRGGGGSGGGNPNSPTTPSPDDGGGEPKPEQPSPGQPQNPEPQPQPEPPGPTDGPLLDVPKILEPVCRFEQLPLGGIVKICPP